MTNILDEKLTLNDLNRMIEAIQSFEMSPEQFEIHFPERPYDDLEEIRIDFYLEVCQTGMDYGDEAAFTCAYNLLTWLYGDYPSPEAAVNEFEVFFGK